MATGSGASERESQFELPDSSKLHQNIKLLRIDAKRVAHHSAKSGHTALWFWSHLSIPSVSEGHLGPPLFLFCRPVGRVTKLTFLSVTTGGIQLSNDLS